jgi:hypothetical protein
MIRRRRAYRDRRADDLRKRRLELAAAIGDPRLLADRTQSAFTSS